MGCKVGEILWIVVRFNRNGKTGRQRGSRGRCRLVDKVFRLDIIKVSKAGSLSDGFVEQVTISGGVHLDDEGRKEDMHTEATHPNKATSPLALMGLQAVEGVSKVGDVETVANQYFFAFERYYRQSVADDRGEGVVPHIQMQRPDTR
jgi:hypothetical protein